MEIPLSIVITTYNRELQLRRCIKSIISQSYNNYEVIIVDDNSTDSYKNSILKEFPQVKYFYQNENRGPGSARNKGIKEAVNNFVVIMDDDDVFVTDAFNIINDNIAMKESYQFPVISFLISNAKVTYQEKFHNYSFVELIEGKLSGDTCQVVNKKIWDYNGYEFPDSKIGAESLLWYQIAIDYGYPVFNTVIVELLEDANNRLTNYSNQILKAELFAQYQIDIVNKFETEIKKNNKLDFLIIKYKGAIVYFLLSSNKKEAIRVLDKLKDYSYKDYIVFKLLTFLNKNVLQKIFLKYRKNS